MSENMYGNDMKSNPEKLARFQELLVESGMFPDLVEPVSPRPKSTTRKCGCLLLVRVSANGYQCPSCGIGASVTSPGSSG
ncbi:hypothetical protein [Streptomyces sp. NPDC002276]